MDCSLLCIFYAGLLYNDFIDSFSKPKHEYSLLCLLWFVLPNIKLDLELLFKGQGVFVFLFGFYDLLSDMLKFKKATDILMIQFLRRVLKFVNRLLQYV